MPNGATGIEGDAGAELARLATAAPEDCVLEGRNAQGEAVPLSISVAPVLMGREAFFVCILRDLTEQQRSQERIYRLAHHDALTGLENRFALNARLEQQLALARRHNEPAAVLFIDLDHFKKINDSLGHAAGDKLLVGAAERMKDLLREVDTLARLGGDEFIIVLAGPLTPDSVTTVAVRVVESLSQPYQLNGSTAHSGCSVGVALFPDDGLDAETLIRHADMAMYAAKREGRGNFQFFSPAMNAATHEHLLLENRMWGALHAEGFELYLQAQVELDTGRVIGAEVLLRWNDDELGSVEPSRFIPVAEESGMIVPLGDWVLGQTMALLAQWQREGLEDLRLAVNLSARQFSGGTLLSRLDELVAQHGIDPVADGTRNHGNGRHARPGSDPAAAAPVAHARFQTRHRRLRHRLFVAVLSQTVRDRPHQDRPRFRQGHRAQSERCRDRRGHHRPGPFARLDGGGRGRGNPGAMGLFTRQARRRGAGFPVLAADAGRRIPRIHPEASAAST